VRRQDQVLRVIDDEPRLLGLRFRSCINLFVIVSFTWGLYLVVVSGFDMDAGLHGNTLLVSLWATAFAVIRWVEKREDVDFLGAALRYVVLYSGARTARFEPHPFEDLLLLSRVLRVRTVSAGNP
jgi:hypothetical protein